MGQDTLITVLLALIHGVTEILPVSYQGHLLVFEKLLATENPLAVEIALHAGTLAAIIAFYFKPLRRLFRRHNRRLLLMVLAGTIPVAIVGAFFKLADLDEKISTLPISGAGFLVTGIFILYCLRTHEEAKEMAQMSWTDVLAIALMQGASELPGISRSGMTISMALKLDIMGGDAAAFSFLLAIPAMAGAEFVRCISAVKHGYFTGDLMLPMFIGFLISAIVGYCALYVLANTLNKERFKYYAYYCLLLGAGVIAWRLI